MPFMITPIAMYNVSNSTYFSVSLLNWKTFRCILSEIRCDYCVLRMLPRGKVNDFFSSKTSDPDIMVVHIRRDIALLRR